MIVIFLFLPLFFFSYFSIPIADFMPVFISNLTAYFLLAVSSVLVFLNFIHAIRTICRSVAVSPNRLTYRSGNIVWVISDLSAAALGAGLAAFATPWIFADINTFSFFNLNNCKNLLFYFFPCRFFNDCGRFIFHSAMLLFFFCPYVLPLPIFIFFANSLAWSFRY